MRTVAAVSIASLLLASLSYARSAMSWGSDALNPYTAMSHSGEFSLHINPGDYSGFGPGVYALSRKGQLLWTREFPFSFQVARVSDSGKTVGYAFTRTERDVASLSLGNLVVALISSTGEIVNTHVPAIQHSMFPDASPTPGIEGLMLVESVNRYIVRVADPDINRDIEQWWAFDLVDGKRTGTIEPAMLLPPSDGRRWIVAAEPVAGTALILCHWWVFENDRAGALFTLVDPDAKPVWSLALADDYECPGDPEKEDRLRDEIREEGAIVSANVPGNFDIHVAKTGERVTFSVEKDARGKWKVEETSRLPYHVPAKTIRNSLSGLPQVVLEKRGVITLQTGAAGKRNSIHDIQAFEFDAHGNICFLKNPPQEVPSVLLVSPEGEVIQEMDLPVEPSNGDRELSNVAHAGGSAFLVAVSSSGEEGSATCYRVDFDKGSITALAHADIPPIDALAAFDDGTVAALTTREMKYSSVQGLFMFDVEGRTLWKREDAGTDGSPDDLLSPEDFVIYPPDQLAILDVVASTIQIFNRNGDFVRAIDLRETLEREHMYPTDLAMDDSGDFIVYDFAADQPVVLIDSEGTLKTAFAPRFPDGRPFRIHDGVKRGPDGALWTSDGITVLRLDANNMVDRVLGDIPQTQVLSEPSVLGITVSHSGYVYIGDEQSKTIHVFDRNGIRQAVCVPDPDDLIDTSWITVVTASNAGDVFVNYETDEQTYIHFAANGARMGQIELDRDLFGTQWYCQPDGNRLWVLGLQDLSLIDRTGNVLRTVSRRKDNNWLSHLTDAAVAPDGSIALLAGDRETCVNTYTNTGDPIGMFLLDNDASSSHGIAFDGANVYLHVGKQLVIFNATGTPVATAMIDFIDDQVHWRGPFLYPASEELWFVSLTDLTVHRYALPPTLTKAKQGEFQGHP